METISSIALGIFANLLSDGTKTAFKALFSVDLNREIEKAYNNAVDQWTNNDKARTLKSIQQPEKIKQLQDTFEHPEKWKELPVATKELLQLFESELRKTDLTRHWLDSEQHRAMMNVGLENGYKLDEVLELLNGYVSQQKAHFLTNTPPFADETTVIHREKDVAAIEAELQQHNSLLLVNGFGGIGKTSLAQLVFRKIHDRYDEVAWINYQGDLRESLLHQIQMDALKYCKDDEERIRTIMNLRNDGKSKLFIIDNVDSGLKQNPGNDRLLKELTGWPKTTLILTSRLDGIGKAFRRIAVNNLNEEACIDLFYLYYGEDKERLKKETVRKLVNLVSCHTFSVELIAKAARQKNLEGYYSDLVEKGVGFSTREIDADHAHGESLTIAQHLKKLFDMQQRTGDEIKALNDIAVLPTDSYSLEEMGSWLGYDGDNLWKLTRDGWLSYKDERYAMHPIVKEIIRLDYVDGKAPQGTATHFLDFISDDKNGYFNKAEIYTSTQRKIAIAEAVLETVGTEESELFAYIYHNIGGGLEQLADFDKALVYYEKSLKIKEKVLGAGRASTATTYNNIAGVYQDQGNYGEALEFYRKALKIREKVLGKEHPGTATTYNNIALVYYAQGNYGEALEFCRKALEILEKVLGKEHPYTATTYNNIAGVYKAQGNYGEALEFHRKSLEIREKVLGLEHPDTATTYNNIALVYQAQGNYGEALEFYRKALEICEKVLGLKHPSTATTYNNIAGVYYAQGHYGEALEYYRKALKIREEVLGLKHPSTATTYNNIALVYKAQGNYGEALEYYRKTLKICEEVLGLEHPDTAATYNNMGVLYYYLFDYQSSMRYLLKSYKVRLEKLGNRHSNTISSVKNIHACYLAMGKNPDEFEKWLAEQLK